VSSLVAFVEIVDERRSLSFDLQNSGGVSDYATTSLNYVKSRRWRSRRSVKDDRRRERKFNVIGFIA